MNIFIILLLFLGGILLTIGDLIMKEWVINNKMLFYVAGLAVYLVGLMLLAHTFKYKNIAVASTMFVIFNVVTLSLASWILFKEPLSIKEIAGIALGLSFIYFCTAKLGF